MTRIQRMEALQEACRLVGRARTRVSEGSGTVYGFVGRVLGHLDAQVEEELFACMAEHVGPADFEVMAAEYEDMLALRGAGSCSCRELEPEFEKGHHPDCGLWDSKAGAD